MRKLTVILFIFTAAAAAFSQSAPKAEPPQSDAQKAFAKLKTMSGTWQGTIMGISINITIRAASKGTTILHEMKADNGPTPDHEITMFYLDGDRLLATHYCDAGNRSNMEGKLTPDGKTLEFSFLELIGSPKGGYVKTMRFTPADGDRHGLDFTFVRPDGKPMPLNAEFKRTK